MAKKEKIMVYTDGGSRGNPGPSGIGVVIKNSKKQIIKKYSKDIGKRTNNEAEYEAVIFAMQKLKQLFGKEKVKNFDIEIRTDSELVIRQINGKYKIKEEKLFSLFIKIWNLKMDFSGISFQEIPRSQNKEADALVNEVLGPKKQQTIF